MNHHLPLRNKIIIMISVMASLFLVALDQTIIATALGKIVEEFNAFDSLSWIVTAYLLTTTITVPIAGKLSDLFGRRVVLLVGVAVFGFGSLMSGMAGDVNNLVLWRAFQGMGGGIITANAFTIVGDLFAARERSKWQGIIGAVFGLSSVVGPLLGGWLTDGHSFFGAITDWRWTFYINVPISLAAFALIAVFCPPLRHAKRPRIDYLGATLLTVALGVLVLAVDNTDMIFKSLLDSSALTLTSLRVLMAAIVIMATIGFIKVQQRADEPIIPLRFFRNRTFSLVMGVATLFGVGFMGAILYLTQFNQQVFGASPTESGLMLIPMVAGIMVSSIGGGQLIARNGRYKPFMQAGIVIATIMIALLATLSPESGYWYEAIVIFMLGIGLGLVMPVMNLAVQNEFEQKELGVATSSIQLFRGLGSTIGIAVFGAMLTAGLTSQYNEIHDNSYIVTISEFKQVHKIGDLHDTNTLLTINMPDVKEQIRSGYERGVQQSQLPLEVRENIITQFQIDQAAYSDNVTHAFSSSLRTIFIISAVLMALAVALVFFLPNRELKHASDNATPGEM